MRWIRFVLLVCLVLAATACHRHKKRAASVKVLDEAPCVLPLAYGAWIDKLEKEMRPEFEKSGVAGLDRAALERVYPQNEYEALASQKGGVCTRIHYESDKLPIAGFILRPPMRAEPKLPVIVYARGGSGDFGKIDERVLMLLTRLARDGFVVVASQYRGSDGAPGSDEYGGADLHDLENLVPLARALPDADAKRLFLYGASRGGMMAMLALKRKMPVRAAAVRGAMVDLEATAKARDDMRQVFEQRIPNYKADPARAYAERSAINWPASVRAPLLFLHARKDWRVDLGQVEKMDAALGAEKREHKLVVVEDDVHQLLLHREEEAREVSAWFRAHLN